MLRLSLMPGRRMAQGMLLILVVLAAYSPTFQAGFIWDDDDYVTENQTLTSLEGLYRIWFDLGAPRNTIRSCSARSGWNVSFGD